MKNADTASTVIFVNNFCDINEQISSISLRCEVSRLRISLISSFLQENVRHALRKTEGEESVEFRVLRHRHILS